MLNDQVATSRATRQHIQCEESNSVDVVMDVIGSERILFTQGLPSAGGGYSYNYQQSHDGVREYYTARNERIKITPPANLITEISSGWHTFFEALTISHLRADDSTEQIHVAAILVPQDEHGDVVGECTWRRFPDFRVDPGDPAPSGNAWSRVDLLDRHNEMIAAIEGRDPVAVADLFNPYAGLITNAVPGLSEPAVSNGRDQMVGYYSRLFDLYPQIEIECINRFCGEWFVYSDQLWHLHDADGDVQDLRRAECLPVGSDRRFVAHNVYSVTA